MEMASPRFVFLAALAFIGVLFSSEIGEVSGQECGADVGAIVAQCAVYVQKGTPPMDPSKGCCDVINKVDIPCACKHVTKAVEEMVDMKKVVHVVSYCGRPLHAGMKCGSFTVPGSG